MHSPSSHSALESNLLADASHLSLQSEGIPLTAEHHGETVQIRLPGIRGYSIVEIK